MSVQLIDRTQLGDSKKVTVEDFLSLCIDYRPLGDQRAQLIQLDKDLEHVAWDAHSKNGMPARLKVEEAYYNYMSLIRSSYTADVKRPALTPKV